MTTSNNLKGCTTLIAIGAGIFLTTIFLAKQAIIDSYNPRTVKISATDLSYRIKPDKRGNVVNIQGGQAPPEDYEVLSIQENGKPFVGKVNNSFARWFGEQRAETFISINAGAKRVAGSCNILILEVSGEPFNLFLFGKNYPVIKSAKPGC